MKVTVLVENTGSKEFAGEHGLSLYVEHNSRRYLIDTGATGLFSVNAKNLNIDLSLVDMAFLSHAHYDHSGGYDEFFALNKKAKVYLQEACRTKYYFKIVGPIKKYIGIPNGILEKYSDRFEYVNGYMEADDGVYICPHTMEEMALRGERARMFTETAGNIEADDFSHEQTIVFEEDDKRYLFNSCSHGGVENIIAEIKNRFQCKEIKAFFGGFHLMGALGTNTCAFDETEVKEIAKTLKDSCKATFYTGHCTGKVAEKWLKDILADRYIGLYSGMEISL